MTDRRLGLAYAATAGLCFVVAMLFALSISPTYTTDALLIPKEQANSTSQSSGLAAATKLLGLGSGSDQSSNFAKFQKYWASRDVAKQLATAHPELMKRLFGSNWDQSNNKWYDHPHNLRQWLAVPLNGLFGVYPSYAPSAQDLATYIKSAMKLEADPLSMEVHITYSASDARFAQWFLSVVISQTDQAVRAAEQRRDRDFIDFSRQRLERETNVEYRQALTDSVRQFEISNMYSEAGANFSFQYVEAPALPINHSAPRPLLYAVLAFIFANLVGMCVTGAMLLWPHSGFSRRIDHLLGKIDNRFSRSAADKRHRAI